MSYNFTAFDDKAQKQIEFAKQQFSQLRTGKASIQMLDSVSVEAYGSYMKLNEVSNVSVADPQLLHVTPWDKSLLGAIEKAVASAGLNLNAVVDRDMIRIPVPALTEDRRKEMVKLLYKHLEEIRANIRVIRGDFKKEIEMQEGKDGVSEDDVTLDLDQLEKKVKQLLEKLDAMTAVKEKELMTI